MIDLLDRVRDHYGSLGLTDRLKSALAPLASDDQLLTPRALSTLDQFHTRGLAATAELAELAEITASMTVLDVGSGIGGPARFLAATYGCRVTGVDLSEPFVDAAQYLTQRTGQSGQVSFLVGSALDLPFEAGSFDIVLLQHVAMNIADRDGLYRELHRVLKPAARLPLSEIVLNEGEPIYPVPWARTPETSFLLTASETAGTIEQAGFHMLKWQDETEQAKQWSLELRASGPPPSPNLGLVMGPDYAELVGNLGRNINQGRLGVVAAVFERA